MLLETERLLIRPFAAKDAEDVYEYCSRPEVSESAGWAAHRSREETSRILECWMAEGCRRAIVLRDSGKVVGHISAVPDSEEGREDTRELGCALNPLYHRRGIMTEAVRALMDSLFAEDTGVEYFWACCFRSNLASKGMIEKCGFAFIKEGSFYSESLDKEFPSYEYCISRSEWNKLRREEKL